MKMTYIELLFFSPKVHIQTIGILVSEKSELQTALGHTQQAARQKTGRSPLNIQEEAGYVFFSLGWFRTSPFNI